MVSVREGAAVEPVGDVVAELGEAPYWVPEDDCLLWVDIPRGELHRTYFPSRETLTVDLGAVSAAFPALGGGILTAGGSRLVLRLPAERGENWTSRTIGETPAREGIRFNDAAVDPAGRVWVGSMHIAETDAVGELFRLDPGGVLTTVVKGVTISNGISWSPDGARMYYVDSPARRVDVFDYDPATGEAFQRRVFSDLTDFPGVPDGLTVDADGYIWVAMHNGSALLRLAPDGERDAVLELPVSMPTSCAFGGPGMSDLFVTTASRGLDRAGLAAQPLAGRLLRVHPGPVGLPSTTTYATLPA